MVKTSQDGLLLDSRNLLHQHTYNMESIKLPDGYSNRKERRAYQKEYGIKLPALNIPYIKKMSLITR